VCFDRLFGIGNVSIKTAGFSGANQVGPEEKLEGIMFHGEVRDFILAELRTTGRHTPQAPRSHREWKNPFLGGRASMMRYSSLFRKYEI
jgi:hypothetical protein